MTRRRWARDSIALVQAFCNVPCRVCGLTFAVDDRVHRWRSREELGQGHEACGFYVLDGDTWADRDASRVARAVLFQAARIRAGHDVVLDSAIGDEAIGLALARRIDGQMVPTTIGQRLFEQIRASKRAASGSVAPLLGPGAPGLDARKARAR